MKPPPYRLEIVREQRERAKKDAEENLAATQRALKEEQAKLEKKVAERKEVDVRKARAEQQFQEALMRPGVHVADESAGHDAFQKMLLGEARRLDEEVAKQKQAVRRAEQRVEDARLALTQAAMELEAMEKHKEKWLKEAKREIAEKEQRQQEEIGEAMWLAERRKAELRGGGGES